MVDEPKTQDYAVSIPLDNTETAVNTMPLSESLRNQATGLNPKTVNLVNHADKMVTINQYHVYSSDAVRALSDDTIQHEIQSSKIPGQSAFSINAQHNLVPGLFPAIANCDYYNLIVAGDDDFTTGRVVLREERVLKNNYFTEDFIIDSHLPLAPEAKRRLCSYPTIF